MRHRWTGPAARAVVLFLLVVSLVSATAAADDDYSRDWILVRLAAPLVGGPLPPGGVTRTGLSQIDALIERSGVRRIDLALPASAGQPRHPARLARLGLDRTYRFHVPPGTDVLELAARFAALDSVELAEPDFVGTGSATPSDARFGDQWAYQQATDADVDGPEAWDVSTGDPLVIAVLDTGVDSDHEDFAGKLLPGYDFANGDTDPEDDHGHGSNVASVAAAASDNGIGVVGACWNCRIMPLKVLDSSNSGLYSWWSDALVYAADHGADVINLSAGGTSNSGTLRAAVRYAYEAGVIHVSITHNDNTGTIRYPGRYPETITVGGTDSLDQRAAPFCYSPTSGSNWGPEIDVVAPGELILGVARGGGYNSWCGTSQAAPLVSGTVGLMESLNRSLGREEARHLLQSGAEDQVGRPSEDKPGFDQYDGWGRVNMHRTLLATRASTTLRADGASATRLYFSGSNLQAFSYDFVRGLLSDLTESADGVDLGSVTCIEDDSVDGDTLGNEDTDVPSPGAAFVYVARFNGAPGPGSYGGSTHHRDRLPAAGGCAD